VGEVLSTQTLREVAGTSEYARRIRELRDEEGMDISTNRDRADLKPGQYVLESLKLKPALPRSISLQLRNEILERNGFTCQLCGVTAGDPDPADPSKHARLHVDHVKPITQGGTNDRDNLRVLCTACNLGKKDLQTTSEGALNLLSRVRRAPRAVQREVYEALKRTFGEA